MKYVNEKNSLTQITRNWKKIILRTVNLAKGFCHQSIFGCFVVLFIMLHVVQHRRVQERRKMPNFVKPCGLICSSHSWEWIHWVVCQINAAAAHCAMFLSYMDELPLHIHCKEWHFNRWWTGLDSCWGLETEVFLKYDFPVYDILRSPNVEASGRKENVKTWNTSSVNCTGHEDYGSVVN